MNCPNFIIVYLAKYGIAKTNRKILISKLNRSVERLKEAASKVNLTDIINLPAFGEITKLELLHFVLYHTQRHTHQLKNIIRIIEIR